VDCGCEMLGVLAYNIRLHGLCEQASFKPLGITIAVAKDRAIESLMQVFLEILILYIGVTKRSLD